MATIFDVSDWFLSKSTMTPKKLQKLCYYYKAWGLALYNEDMLPDSQFEAWVHGPVNPMLYQRYLRYVWQEIPQKPDNSEQFSEREIDLLESIWLTYGKMSGNALEAQTHIEQPWRKAREGLAEFAKSKKAISNEDMRKYYLELYLRNQGE